MYLTVDLDSDVPIYQQIRDRIVEAIAQGEAKTGDALPSTRQLAVDFGINFLTVGKAYDLLRKQGFIRINRKSGAVISRDRSTGPPGPDFGPHWEDRLRILLAEATAQGMSRSDIVGHCDAVLANFQATRSR